MASYVQTLMNPITPDPQSPAAALSAKEYAQELLKNSQKPVHHWAQGMSNLANALVGGLTERKANEAMLKGQQGSYEALLTALGVTPSAAPASGPTASVSPPAKPMFGPTPNEAVADMPGITVTDYQTDLPRPATAFNTGKGLVDQIVKVESGGNPNARNPMSTAVGPGQFITTTWLDMIKKNRPDIAAGKSDAELLALRTNPDISREMTQAYANQNNAALQRAGFDATPGNSYLAHFAGEGGALKVLQASPQTPVLSILGPQVVQANPFLTNMTAGDLRAWADKKMQGVGGPQLPIPQQPYQVASLPAATRTDATITEGPAPINPATAAAFDMTTSPNQKGTGLPAAGPSPEIMAATDMTRANPMAALPPGVSPTGRSGPINPNASAGLAPPPASAATTPPSAGVAPSPASATPPNTPFGNQTMDRKALAAILLNPWASDGMKQLAVQQLMPKDPEIIKLGKDETAYAFNKRTGKIEPVAGGVNNAGFDDTTKLRKEVADLPEVKRYATAAPIFQSMVNSAKNNTAAADLDFVYGIAKIFDPESVVREGEMKLASGASSIPQQIQGWMAQVVEGKGRLTPEQRATLLEVSHTRMNELRNASDQRQSPYEGIVTRNKMNRADVFPQLPAFMKREELPQLRSETPTPDPNASAPPAPANILQQYPNAKQAPDGKFYVPDPNRPGKYLMVNP